MGTRPRPPRGWWTLFVLAASCRTVEVASLNLDYLHGEGARHKYVAPVQTWYQYYFAKLFDPELLREDSWLRRTQPRQVKNPASRCLEYLNDLAAAEPHGPGVAATQVRHFAYLGVECPWSLSRERALLECGHAADRLALGDPIAEPEAAANPPELSEALAGLVRTLTPIVARGRAATPTERQDFAAACELLEGLDYDLEGGRRILEVIASVDRRRRGEALEPLRRLDASIEARMVGLALARGLADRSPRTRAAAFEANWHAYGDAFLGDALLALDGQPPPPEQASVQRFRLREEWPGDPDVFVRVFDLVREHGLPEPPVDDPGLAGRLRLSYLRAMCQVAVDYTTYDDRIRTAAMRALGAVSGAGFESLRMEDWNDWWQAYYPAELAALRGQARESATP